MFSKGHLANIAFNSHTSTHVLRPRRISSGPSIVSHPIDQIRIIFLGALSPTNVKR